MFRKVKKDYDINRICKKFVVFIFSLFIQYTMAQTPLKLDHWMDENTKDMGGHYHPGYTKRR
jgi:hypothetical protein